MIARTALKRTEGTRRAMEAFGMDTSDQKTHEEAKAVRGGEAGLKKRQKASTTVFSSLQTSSSVFPQLNLLVPPPTRYCVAIWTPIHGIHLILMARQIHA